MLGSLSGQLQLATYLGVFLGFSGVSIAGLWLTQRNQAVLGDADLRANARSLETSLLAEHLLLLPPRLKPLGQGRAEPQIPQQQLQQTAAEQGAEGRGEQQLHQGESRCRVLPFGSGWGVHEAGRQC